MKSHLWKRTLCCLLAVVLILGNVPVFSFAEESDGLCEHHPEHTAECGYSPAIPGSPCTHVHTEECYRTVAECVHVHNENCGYSEEAGDSSCTHVCSEEYGCFQQVTDCPHVHDGNCGYAEAIPEQPCTYACQECAEAEADPSEPEEVPSEPEEDPSEPVEVPSEPEEDPSEPVEEPSEPEEEPSEPEEDPSEPSEPEEDPSEPSEPEEDPSEPSEPEGDPSEPSEPEEDPSEPSEPEADEAVETVRALIDALPTLEEVKAMSMDEQAEVYKQVQSAYTAYNALTDDQKAQLPEAEEILAPLFEHFNTLTAPTSGALASGTCGENLTWVLTDDGVLTISGSGKMADYSYSNSDVPDAPWYANRTDITSVVLSDGVTSIGNWAFYGCSKLTSITIPDGVSSIGGGAFSDCSGLTSISIPEGVTSIEYCAFEGCSSLTSITIPEGVTSIGDDAFGYCSSLTSITIPKGVTSIGYAAFYSCTSLTSITIPKGFTSIGPFAFCHCTSLTSITIPEGVTSIGCEAFYNCTSLTSITIPKGVTSIEEGVFSNCTSLTSITIPEGITSIGDDAFEGCSSLTSIAIPEGVASIGYRAFYGCSKLTSITIPKGVTTIGSRAFSGCSSLKKITFTGDAPTFQSDSFSGVVATAYYPVNNSTWTAAVRKNYGGNLTWKSYSKDAPAAPFKPYKITNVLSGVQVYWEIVPGVEKYGLWRSETGINGTYKWLGNSTVPRFTDKTASSGKTYYYKVTSLNAITGAASEKSAAIGIIFVSSPGITSRINLAAGIKLGWEKVTGATGYAVFRKSYDGTDSWKRVATLSGNGTVTWTDTAVKNNNGSVYRYQVRALAGSDMKTLSGYSSTGRTMVRLTSQTLKSAAKASATSIKCNWTTSAKVNGYEVRFMVGSTVYKTFTVGNYKTGTKTFTGLKNGETYKIQVRTYKKVDGVGTFYSGWSTPQTVTLK